ncbi:unnamed protein product [Lymnaea stagnalis]|uniref:Uncharacterized protein n=1 Tax=Lymnaea stagnalis TaxID=6523 RepID=A0AAV2HAJ5_LYMST
MQTSLPDHGQPTSSCDGDSKYVQPFPQNRYSQANSSRGPSCPLARERASQDSSMKVSVCGCLQCSIGHFKNHQQPSLVPSYDYRRCIDHSPTLRPSVGNINLREKIDSKVESPADFGLVLPGGQNPRRSKYGAKSILDVACETRFGVIVVLFLMAVGFVHLRMRIRALEEQNIEQFKTLVNKIEEKNIELAHIKSQVNVLEQLVSGMNGENIQHRLQKTLETMTAAPMSTVKFPKEPHRFPVFTGTTNQPASRGGGLSRAKRDADGQRSASINGVMKSVLLGYCKTKSGETSINNRKVRLCPIPRCF